MAEPVRPDYSVVIPVYNSETTLAPLYERLTAVFAEMGKRFEVIFVNDCSGDNSKQVLVELAKNHDNVVFVDLLRNFGQHNAVMCGFSQVRGDFAITMDDDMQNPPEEIPKLIAKLESDDLEVVYGSPTNKQHQHYRNVGSDTIHAVLKVLFRLKGNRESSFRLLTRKIVDCLLRFDNTFIFLDGLIYQNTSFVGYVDVEHKPRTVGASNYSLSRLISLSLNLFFSFSITPLRVIFILGMVLFLASLVYGAYIFVARIMGLISFPGFATVMILMSLLFGIMFMFMGVLGEYLGRIAININRAPQYSIRSVTRGDDNNKAS